MNASASTTLDGSNGAREPVRLRCLGGGEAPPELGDDLRRLLSLPREALEHFWQVLGPSLQAELSQQTERLLDVYCAAYKIDDEDLARAIKACRFLLREAARI